MDSKFDGLRVTGAAFLKMVPTAYLTAIGNVISQWSILEAMIEACIWRAAGLRNDLGRATTSQLSIQGKMDLLAALLMQTKPKLGEKFQPVADYIRNCLLGRRNTVAHGMWGSNPVTGRAFVTKFTSKGRLTYQGGELSTDELNQLAADIADVSEWVFALAYELPRQKLRRGGLGHKTPNAQNRRDCATRKQNALQPLTAVPSK